MEFYHGSWQLRETIQISHWGMLTVARYVPMVISLLLWMAAAGLNRSDEVRAAAIGFLVCSFVWALLTFSINLVEWFGLYGLSNKIMLLMAAAPGGFISLWRHYFYPDTQRIFPYVVLWILSHVCLFVWFTRRFGRTLARPRRTAGQGIALASSQKLSIRSPMRNQITAVAWKQFRETGPIAICVAGGVLAFTMVFYYFNKDSMQSTRELGVLLASLSTSTCFLVTLITGFAVFFEDLKPGMEEFWRSRPLNFPLWFIVKFMTGIFVLLVSFGSLYLIAFWLTDWDLLRDEPRPDVTFFYAVTCFLLVYTISMANYCLLRQPIYAVVATLGLCLLGILIPNVFWKIFLPEMDRLVSAAIFFGSLIGLQVSATALAWFAMQRNWSLKS